MEEKTKATLHRATIYFVDYANSYENFQSLFDDIYSRALSMDASIVPFDIESAPIAWHDRIDLNNHGAKQEDYSKYFIATKMTQKQIEEELGYKIEIIA